MTDFDNEPQDLTSALEAFGEEDEDEAPKPTPVPDADTEKSQFYDFLEKELAIPRAQVDAWKKTFGSVYAFAPEEKNVYIWRPLFKKEWDVLNERITKIKKEDPEAAQEQITQLELMILGYYVLYPKITKESIKETRAGLQQTLYELIMQGSYFLSSEQAFSLVISL